MKTTRIFLFALINCTIAWAQTNTFPTTGDVGIGTISPTAKLHVLGQNVHFFSNTGENTFEIGRDNNQKFVFNVQDYHGYMDLVQDSDSNREHIMYFRNLAEGTSADNDIRFQTSSVDRLSIKANGNIGIGTTNPNGWKLAVDGNIRAKEIKVETGWSDFVFYADYKLPTLTEVENYIKEKGHLKDIPSAKEVAENGILLGEMDSKLLQKIEELTLYIIDINKRTERLERENAELKKRVSE